MKKEILSTVLMVAALSTQATIYCDTWLSMTNQPSGSTLTTTILNNGTVGKNAGYSVSPSPPTGFTVSTHQIDRYPNIMVGFTNQAAGQYQQAMALDNSHNNTFWTLGVSSSSAVGNLFGWCNFGQTNGANFGSGTVYDFFNVFSSSGEAVFTQLLDGTGANYGIRLETVKNGTATSSIIPLTRNTWYWIVTQLNGTSGTAGLWAYDRFGSLVGHVTLAQATGGAINQIRVGNAEVGISTGTTFFQDVGIDYTYADYTPLGNDTNTVPLDRQVDWTNAGFAVPNVTTVYTNLPAGSPHSDVITALANCPSNQAVVLAAGSYTWTNIVDFSTVGNGKVLRGTRVNGTNVSNVTWTNTRAVRIWGSPSETTLAVDVSVTANIRKGDTNIVLSSVPNWCVPGLVLGLDMLDDNIVSTTNTCFELADIYRARTVAGGNGNRGQGELVVIAATNATTISTREPIMHDFSISRTSQVFMAYYNMSNSAAYPRTMCGVENINFIGDGAAVTDAHAIIMVSCYRCWVTGCGSFLSKSTHILPDWCYQCVIRGNYCYDSSTFASGQGYGISLYDLSTRNLIDNNIVRRSRASYQVNYGSSGNVFAYNYALESHSDSQVGPEIHVHGNSADYNLFEGNTLDGKASFDCVHGSSWSDTLFRNFMQGYVTTEVVAGNTNNQISASIDFWEHNHSVVGNVSGKSGFHDTAQVFAPNACTEPGPPHQIYRWGFRNPFGCDSTCFDLYTNLIPVFSHNYDSVTAGILYDPNLQTNTLPNSLYLTSAPTYFTNSVGLYTNSWPPINTANATYSGIFTNVPSGNIYALGLWPNQAPGAMGSTTSTGSGTGGPFTQ